MRMGILVVLFCAFCVFAMPLISWAEEIDRPFTVETLTEKNLDNLYKEKYDPKTMVGLSVAVVREGKIVLAKGYGKANIKKGLPVTAETKFAIGSITKQFTCASILLLAEQEKLSPNDKVAKYYPKLTQANEITLLDLMNHVSGYSDYYRGICIFPLVFCNGD